MEQSLPAEQIRSILSECELFAAVDESAVERIAGRFHTASFDTGEMLCREGDPGDMMFIVTKGMVSVRRDMDWGSRELQQLGPGEVVGEMSLITGDRRSASVVALSPTTCLHLDRSSFSDLIDSDPHFAQQVAIILTKRLSVLGTSTGEALLNAYRALIFSLANLADSRDPDTGAHLQRTRSYCALLAEILSEAPEYHRHVKPGFAESMYQVSPLHDIGKVAIPDHILLKPGRLTEPEYRLMQSHTVVGAEALRGVLDFSGAEIFQLAYTICLCHHEHWDGTGYPRGLAGEDIPLEARIMSIADVYDALLSRRVYKRPMTFHAALIEIETQSGHIFDPALVRAMVDNIDRFETIHQKFDAQESERERRQ